MAFLCFTLLIPSMGIILQPHWEEPIRYRHWRGLCKSPIDALPDYVWGHLVVCFLGSTYPRPHSEDQTQVLMNASQVLYH